MSLLNRKTADHWTGPDAADIFELIAGQQFLQVSDQDLELLFWTMHPRFAFFKSLPMRANLLDIGANEGGLYYWKEWGAPHRTDINLYGVDLQRGRLADQYAGWDSFNLDERRPQFPGVTFDGFLAAHLIEHLNDLNNLIAYMGEVAAPDAAVYLEWPAPKTQYFPSVRDLRQQGFDIQTFYFFDDSTHVKTYETYEVAERLKKSGFGVASSGQIYLGAVARELAIRGRIADDMVWRQMGLWCATGWCNYIIARKI